MPVESRTAYTRCFEVRFPTGMKCTVIVVLPTRERRLDSVQSVSVAVNKPESPIQVPEQISTLNE